METLDRLSLLKPNFAKLQYIQAYMSLFSGTGKENRDECNDIAREDYPNGYALYAFDLSSDLAKEEHLNLAKRRTKVWNSAPNTVTVVAYAEFENVIEIDAIETSSTTLAVKYEHYRNFRIFEQRFNL